MRRLDYPLWLAVAALSGFAAPFFAPLSFAPPVFVVCGVFFMASHRRRLERWHKPSRYLNCASVIVQQDEELFWRSLESEGPFDEF